MDGCIFFLEENVADIITRGASPNKLGSSSIWQTGPLLLVKNRSEWPATRANEGVSEDEIKEFCSKKKVQTLVASANQSIKDHLDELIDIYRSLDKLIHTTAYILRWNFFKTIQETFKDGRISTRDGKAISSLEYNDAWLWLVYQELQKRLNIQSVRSWFSFL